MADVENKPDDAQENEQQEKKGMNPIMLIGIAVGGTALIAAIAFVIVFKFIMAPPKDEAAVEKTEVTNDAYFGKLFSFDEPIIVNLAGTKGQRYLKVSTKFEVTDDKVIEELKIRTPQILDLLISILSSKTIDDVSNTVGRNRLRREIIDKCNAELMSGKVINVYFTEFVIQ